MATAHRGLVSALKKKKRTILTFLVTMDYGANR